ncbi:hypothetical protein SLNWT_4197 [Streptomyces albus]|uniref:Carbohydrate-binding protein n=1 Tax=Streptomyces albus (strain ATCC 21838 / DSM 41398 / FERM P-419 / JCM 4703 / NBRC 107858) TaxID=1081613 RepID=A0A0B5EP88_STRA4|nr:hypothetical protein SLNWT_4197 [Streptomyces albus]AOU78882.1 hypothetical protein SLNHY_4191 [Streptomyces albus]AYN34617.1 hypothetical protein DUI70_4118 [Streptomyces albus]
MKRVRTTAGVLGAGAALLLACGLGVPAATALPAPERTAPQSAAANPCTSAAADSGRQVAGALPRAEVHRQLDAQAERHRAARELPGKGPVGAPGDGSRLKVDIHPAQGTAFKEAAGRDGACATHTVSREVDVTEGSTTIYTPTLYPAGGSCIELVTVYTQGRATVSAWDWCKSVNFEASVPIDDAFLAAYTDGSSAYTGRVVRTDAGSNTWTASLYNHTTGAWDEVFTQSGQTQGRNDGWDIYELYSTTDASNVAYSCHAMAGLTFESSNISVRTDGQWAAASPDNSDTHYDQPDSAFYCPGRSYSMVNQYDHWKAVG